MAGYIGTKAVNLSTTGADIAGDADVSGALDVGGGLTVDNDGSTVLTVDRATSDGTIIDVQKSGSSVGVIGSGSSRLTIGDGATGLRFVDASTDRISPWNLSTNTDRDNAIDLGESGGRFKDLYLSGGVYLGGTGSANKLDDYEEGAWTPSANNGSFTGVVQGRYTKVGNKVTVWAHIQGINDTTTSSTLEISGLPFSSVSSGVLDSTSGPIMLRYLDVGVTEEMGVVVYISGGSSVLRIYVLQAGGTYTAVQNAHFNNGGIGFRLQITYQV